MLNIEQAKQAIANAPAGGKTSAERLRLLLLHSKNFYRQNPKQSEKWAREALKLATKLKDAEGVARAHYHIGAATYQLNQYGEAEKQFRAAMELDNPSEFEEALLEWPIFSLGLAMSKKGKFHEAIELYEKALKLSREYRRKSEIDILGALGNAALEQGDYPKALEYQYASLAILDAQDDPLRRSVVLSNIGRIYLDVQAYEKADYFFERSYNIKNELQDKSGLDIVIYNRGVIAQKNHDHDSARELYTRSLKFAASVDRKDTVAYNEDCLGSLELAEGRPKVALAHFRHALELSSSLNIKSIWCESLIGIGISLLALKKPIDAIRSLKESLAMCEESRFLPLQCECVSILASAYEAAGKLKESVQYFNRFIALNAEVHNEQKQHALVEISARVEIEKADRERARLEQLAKDADGRAALLRSETERQSKELTALALQLVQKNEFLCNLKEEIEPAIKSPRKSKKITDRIDAHIKSDRDWETFEHQFDQVHGEFLKRLAVSYATLTPTEIKIAALVKLNLPTKAMSNLLCLSTRTVENHRMSIRRKVGLGAEGNLVSFLTRFGEAK